MEHKPVYCEGCGPKAWRVVSWDDLDNWYFEPFIECEECDSMCDACSLNIQNAYHGSANAKSATVREFRECIHSVRAPEAVPANGEPCASMDVTRFEGGGVRESDDYREQPHLLWPLGVPYSEQFVTRMAQVLGDGAHKYEPRNWENFRDRVALERAKASASRHFNAWLSGDESEDHAAAAAVNLMFAETIKWKMENENDPN